MQAYHDNPFEVNGTQGDPDLNDYYDTVPAPSRFSGGFGASSSASPLNQDRPGGGFNSIPLSAVPAGASAPYRSLNEQSTDDLTSGLPISRHGTNPPNTGGFGMTSTRYSPIGREHNGFNSGSEPKLGAYASGSAWEARAPKSSRKKWIVMGGILTLVGIIIVAVTAGVVISSKKKSKNLSSSGSGSSSSSNSSAVPSVVSQTDPNDPSTFVKDPNLHQSFYGLAYTPYGSQVPDCGNSLAAVIQDIQIMSQLTKRVRIYGADCNQSALVLDAIKQTKVNMTVYLANYNLATDNGTAYERQRSEIDAAIATFGSQHIGGVTVGNEFMLDYLDDNGATDPNGAVGNAGAAILIANIKDTMSNLTSMGVNVPVGTSDAGAYFNNEVMAVVDYGMANVHPWFANVSAQDGAAWTWEFFEQTDVALGQSLPNKPQMSIAETGWPTQSSDVGNESNGPSTASEANLQVYLDTFVCQANANGTEYYFFEFADESWKDVQFGGVEGWWGLFHQNRTLKHITIPNCQAP